MKIPLLIFLLARSLGTPEEAPPAAHQDPSPPKVLKVEPPSWWIGHSLNPVRLLIRGENLGRARIEASRPGIQVSAVRPNEAGTYLFADVLIDRQAEPGPSPLKIVNGDTAAEAPFEILAPLERQGRFQGISPADVIYLIMPDRFSNGDLANDDPLPSRGLWKRQKPRYYHGGDLAGIQQRLPYLKELGVTALWLNPIYDNANRLNERETYDGQAITDYHGYGAVDLYGVEEHFGGLEKLRELVEAAHRSGIKVIQDQVANHVGPYHPWVKDPPSPGWLNGTESDHLSNNWQIWTLADPHAPYEIQKATLEGWFINILPDLNQRDEETARYLIQNALWWIGRTGIDGIRQDALPYMPRRFWSDWRGAIRREYPALTVIGEVWDGNPALVSFFQGGKVRFDGIDTGIEALFDFPLFYPLRRAFAEGKPIRDAAVALSQDHLYPDPSRLVTFLGLHDVPRFMNEPNASIAGLKLAFTFLFTVRGIPLLYYGDEIAMRGGGDPDNRRDFPGGWPDDPQNKFEPSGRTAEEQEVFEHVRRLAHLRAELEPLQSGSLVHLLVGEQTYAFARVKEGKAVIAIFNNGQRPAALECGAAPAGLADGARLADRLGSAPEARVEGGKIRVSLPARTAAAYK